MSRAEETPKEQAPKYINYQQENLMGGPLDVHVTIEENDRLYCKLSYLLDHDWQI